MADKLLVEKGVAPEVLEVLEKAADATGCIIEIVDEIAACPTCDHFSCVCGIRKNHTEWCRFRIAATCAVGIACDPHGRDVCPVCDTCDCGA